MTPDELALLVEDACIDGWVTVPSTSKRGVAYRLTVIHDWPEACTCPGYAGHGHCHHLDEAREVWLRTVPTGVVMSAQNEKIAVNYHAILDRSVVPPYPEATGSITSVMWLHSPKSEHPTRVTLTVKGRDVGITVSDDLPGSLDVSVTVPFGQPMPLPALRRLIEFPPARRILWEWLTTALTGRVVERPKPWAP